MAGGGKDFPEHFEAGLKPHCVAKNIISRAARSNW